MQKQEKGGFTLVELIVVITILAILGTIAFISLQGYSRDARDSARTSDLGNIKTSLELYSLKTGKFPKPDSYSTITYSGGTENVWFQGVVGDIVTTNLKSLNEKPLDPLINTEYTYSVTNSYKEYEVLALYEGSVAYNPIINQTNAAVSSLTPKIVGNYNGVFVKTPNYIIPIPSIVTSETLIPGSGTPLNSSTINSLVITNGTNIPKNSLTLAQTGSLNINLSVYTGSITKNSTNIQKINVIQTIQLAYSGTTIANNNQYAYILNKKANNELLQLTNNIILKLIPIKKANLDFISLWDTTKLSSGSSLSNQIKLPLEPSGIYNFNITWGDGNSSLITSWNQPEIIHTYTSEGIYQINISGTIQGFRFAYTGDKLKILDITQWGNLNFGNNGFYFYGASNLVGTALDSPDLLGTTNMYAMFYQASNFIGNIGNWDVSGVTNIRAMFGYAFKFNSNLNNWNVANVTDMKSSFQSAQAFNQPLNNWNVTNVNNMFQMFNGANKFNQNLSSWNVINVIDCVNIYLSTPMWVLPKPDFLNCTP